MAGVRRKLLDVGKKVSGVLAGQLAEVPGAPALPGVTGSDDPARSTARDAPADPPADRAPVDAPASPPAAPDPVKDPVPAVDTPAPTGQPSAAPDPALDPQCAAAVDLARAAALEEGGDTVGEHLGVEAEPTPVGHAATHSFATSLPGYAGWRWAVTVARGADAATVTVDEVVLLPGDGALLAPAWVPWADRVQPGDLGPGDLLPPPPDDPRLVPSYADVDADELPFALHRELGLGRPRVLSAEGRAEAAQRWYDGDRGPDTPLAKAAPGRCGTCGFLVPLTGALGRLFGACGNARSPEDARVVALTHGCGAHSETVVDISTSSYSGMAVEDDEFELLPPGQLVPGDADGDDVPDDLAGLPGLDLGAELTGPGDTSA